MILHIRSWLLNGVLLEPGIASRPAECQGLFVTRALAPAPLSCRSAPVARSALYTQHACTGKAPVSHAPYPLRQRSPTTKMVGSESPRRGGSLKISLYRHLMTEQRCFQKSTLWHISIGIQ